jgi:hypothetical protein
VLGILKDLPLGRAARSRIPLGSLPAPILHFALVESHPPMVTKRIGVINLQHAPGGGSTKQLTFGSPNSPLHVF